MANVRPDPGSWFTYPILGHGWIASGPGDVRRLDLAVSNHPATEIPNLLLRVRRLKRDRLFTGR